MFCSATEFRAALAGVLTLGLCLAARPASPAAEAPSQVQVARRFLLAVLGGHRAAAYRMLAPETQVRLSPQDFATAAQPLYDEGQRRGATIDLYKFGFRMDDTDSQPFCAFMFRSDTTAARPEVQLDVTFGSAAARQVQGFSLVPPPAR